MQTTITPNYILTCEPVTKEGVPGKLHKVIRKIDDKVELEFWFADEYQVKEKVKQLKLL